MKRDTILVPVDFTPVADCALDHALEIAKLFDHKIYLLHVIGKKTPEKERTRLQTRIENIAASNSKRSGIHIYANIVEGSIFDQINKTADELNAEFIIMGIHGTKGVQHIVGSYAYKIVESSVVPVMVVKNRHHHLGYNNIVIPIHFGIDSSQTINQAIKFAKYFHSTIHVIGILGSKSSVYKIEKEVLLKKVVDYIDGFEAKSVAEVIIRPGSDIHNEVLDYAVKIDADLIMIVAEKSGRYSEIFGKNTAEHIIDKADIPVLTVKQPEIDEEDDETLLSSFFDPLGLIEKQ